jgi:hypothetical protein
MTEDALDADVFHFRQRPAQDRVHEKHVRHAVRLERLREKARARHLLSHACSPWVDLRYASRAACQQFVEKRVITPAKAGVQKTRVKQINTLLDAGFRRHDEIMVAGVIFNKLLALIVTVETFA